MTRSLIEQVMRQRLRGLPNVVLRDRCRVLELVAEQDGTVNAVRCETDGRAWRQSESSTLRPAVR